MKFDTHVRARASLARKVAQRRYVAGMNPVGRASFTWALGKLPDVEDLIPAAYEALAKFGGAEDGVSKWPDNWAVKYSRYRVFGRPMYVDGQTKDVAARVIHRIMVCMPDLPQFTRG